MDEEIDIDGDDQVAYGETQFTEGDILPLNNPAAEDPDVEVNIEDEDEESEPPSIEPSAVGSESRIASSHPNDTLVKLHLSIESAKQKGDKKALVAALQSKITFLASCFT